MLNKLFLLMLAMFVGISTVHADDGGKAFLEKFYREGTECYFNNNYVKMYLTKNATKFLKDSYPYDNDNGEGMATWLFYQEGGWDLGDFREYRVNKVKENTYRVIFRSNFNEDVYEYSTLFGLVNVGNTWAIDTMKPESGRLVGQEQGIKDGSTWNIGSLDYEAKVEDVNTFTFRAMSEGEELSFRLKANPDKEDEYVLGDNPHADGYNPYSDITRVKYIKNDGWKLLCLYDQKGRLQNILDGTQSVSGEKVAESKWTAQLSGEYTDRYGDNLEIGWGIIYEKGVARAEYKHITFNGTITGVISISGLTYLEGTWEAVVTLKGLTLYQVEPDEYGMYKRNGHKELLTWSRNDRPRFNYTWSTLLNDGQFRRLKKSTLRIMRNEILARHGYMVSSPDLVEFFGSQSWFSPRPSNDDVFDELSLVEQLNIELIKAEEAKSDGDRYVTEE